MSDSVAVYTDMQSVHTPVLSIGPKLSTCMLPFMHTWHATGTHLRVQILSAPKVSNTMIDDSVQKLDLGKAADLERQIALP